MGKVTSIYLSDEEVTELKKFCEKNQCSQYAVLKMALRELLFEPHPKREDTGEREKKEKVVGKNEEQSGQNQEIERKQYPKTDARDILKYLFSKTKSK